MKLIFGLLAAMVIGQAASASTSASTSMAASSDITGTYSTYSVVRFWGYTPKDCKDEGGKFVAADPGDTASRTQCIIEDKNGDTLEISKDSTGRLNVSISVVYGPANMRDFTGAVVKRKGNTLKVVDLSPDEPSKACTMVIKIVGKTAVSVTGNEFCDSNLDRVAGAKKK